MLFAAAMGTGEPSRSAARAVQGYPSPLTAHALRLLPGDDLRDSLLDYCVAAELSATTVLSCVGSLSEITLRLAGATEMLHLQEPLEIISLVGTICEDRSHHLHCSVSRRDGSVVGGHVKGAAPVATTAEVVLGHMPAVRFAREHEEATGYLELRLQQNAARGPTAASDGGHGHGGSPE